MRKAFYILVSTFLGLLLSYQITAVFSHNQTRLTTAIHSTQPVEIVDLGTLGGESSQAADLNEKGAVVGSSMLSPGQEIGAFLWQNDSIQPLNAANDLSTQAFAINESAVSAGAVISGTGDQETVMPALWDEGVYVPLAAGEGEQGSARDINDSGIVAGHTFDLSGNDILLWENNTLTETIPVDTGLVEVNALNNQNQIVGLIHDGDTENDAFLWQDGAFEALGTLGGQNSIAHDINDEGRIVGAASVDEDLGTHAFLWQEGEMTDLGTLEDVPGVTSRALGINSNGAIVGEAQVGDVMHAVMWLNGQIVDLNGMLAVDSEWELLNTAVSINDKGWIVGNGLIEGKEHAFLMRPAAAHYFSYLPVVTWNEKGFVPTPTPEPSPTPTMPPPIEVYDLARYITGSGRLYVVHFVGGGIDSKANHQTQFNGDRFYHTKGNAVSAEWEEFWNDGQHIYRGTDTSPGGDMFYTLYENLDAYSAGSPGSKWIEQVMEVGDNYFRQPYVVFRNKSDCSISAGGYYDPSWLKFQKFHETVTFENGIILNDVIELAWIPGNDPTQPVDETYFYAEGYGLVRWEKPGLGLVSAISEELDPDALNNNPEVIPCLNEIHNAPQSWNPRLRTGALPEPYAGMVKP